MAGKTQFEQFIADEIEKNRGRLVPVKASFAERMFVRKANWKDLHPNPDDEFCFPSIGPNYGIIANYEQMILESRRIGKPVWTEPIMVEKVLPEGYMILNGHHRWGAAVKTNYSPLAISIVNLTQETDVARMVARSRHDKRVTLDLDELVFCSDGDDAESPLSFPFSRWYKRRIRRGIPALLHHLSKLDYDVWAYSSDYFSYEYIRAYFRHYSVCFDGIITGMARKGKVYEAANKRMSKMLYNQYGETLHIDRDAILRTGKNVKPYEVYSIEAGDDDWVQTVMNIVDGLEQKERTDESIL